MKKVTSLSLAVAFAVLAFGPIPASASAPCAPGWCGGYFKPKPGVMYPPGFGGPVFCAIPGVDYPPGYGTSPKPADYCEDQLEGKQGHAPRHDRAPWQPSAPSAQDTRTWSMPSSEIRPRRSYPAPPRPRSW